MLRKLTLTTLLISLQLSRILASSSDIQSAIDRADAGATVTIPAGTQTWNSAITIRKVIRLVGAGNGATTIVNATPRDDWGAALIFVVPQAEGSVDISNLRFTRTGGSIGKHITVQNANGRPVIVHDCYFGNGGGSGQKAIEWQTNGGLIYNCEFVSEDKSNSQAICFKMTIPPDDSRSTWRQPTYLGNADTNGTMNTYVEDCTFKDFVNETLDPDDNSRTVIRHCIFDNAGTASHGPDTGNPPTGLRHFEYYDNTFIFTLGGNCNPNPYPLNINWWFYIRGGTGVIFNNVLPSISSCAWGSKSSVVFIVQAIRRRTAMNCPTTYPVPRSPGQGLNTSLQPMLDPIYVWGNTGSGATNVAVHQYEPDECGNRLLAADFTRAGRDYIVGTPRPGYTPYQYPHPLRVSGPEPSPTAIPPLDSPITLTEATPVTASSVRLAWTVSGNQSMWFRILRGQQSGQSSGVTDVADVRSATISGLTPGNWFFRVQRFISGSNSTAMSNELSVVVGVPSPTPTPTPSPTPTPTPSYENWINQLNQWIRQNPPTP